MLPPDRIDADMIAKMHRDADLPPRQRLARATLATGKDERRLALYDTAGWPIWHAP